MPRTCKQPQAQELHQDKQKSETQLLAGFLKLAGGFPTVRAADKDIGGHGASSGAPPHRRLPIAVANPKLGDCFGAAGGCQGLGQGRQAGRLREPRKSIDFSAAKSESRTDCLRRNARPGRRHADRCVRRVGLRCRRPCSCGPKPAAPQRLCLPGEYQLTLPSSARY